MKIRTVYLFFLQDFILPSVNVNVYRSLVYGCNKIKVLSYYPIRNISFTRFLVISLKVKSFTFFHLVIFRFANNAYAMQFRGSNTWFSKQKLMLYIIKYKAKVVSKNCVCNYWYHYPMIMRITTWLSSPEPKTAQTNWSIGKLISISHASLC